MKTRTLVSIMIHDSCFSCAGCRRKLCDRLNGEYFQRIRNLRVTIVRHAAAVILALSISGTVPTIGGGTHPPPSPPLLEEDLDRDNLCDIYDNEIFGTDPQLADTDGDGIPDGDEDHDRDGLSNLEELNQTVALMDAVEIGDTEKVKALLEYSPYISIIDDWSLSPLMLASDHGFTETVQP